MGKPKDSVPKEITAIKLRHNLGEILDQVANKRARFLVKRSGIPAAVLLSISDYEDLQDLFDTWQEQQDKPFQESLDQARREIGLDPAGFPVPQVETGQDRFCGDIAL